MQILFLTYALTGIVVLVAISFFFANKKSVFNLLDEKYNDGFVFAPAMVILFAWPVILFCFLVVAPIMFFCKKFISNEK